ncbi:MAG TPA: amino acid permease [Thermoanaerobaculia bacterium]|nr:amino acid permease [Thermoanaerobaculia bacterium]
MGVSSGSSRRELGLWMCVALVVGNMIGSGVFLLPASLAPFGSASLLGWGFTTAGSLLLALTFARLSMMVPRAGGPYAYAHAGFGRFAGFLVGWGYWNSCWTAVAAIAVAFASYLGVFWPAISNDRALGAMVTIATVWALTLVNILGVRKAGMLQLVTAVLKILPLILIGTAGLLYLRGEHFTPLNPQGGSLFGAVSSSAALTLWAFLGFESATIPAGNVRDPRRTIPRATIIGTLIAATVYILGTVAVMGIMPREMLASSTAPFADAARLIWGDWGGWLVGAGAVISCFGALNGWILVTGSLPMAMAEEGLFPRIFTRISRWGTPAHGLVIASTLVTFLVLANFTRGLVGMFTALILLSTLASLFPYVICSMAQIVLARGRNEQHRFRRDAVIASLGFVYALWAIGGSGQQTVFWGFLFLLAGVPVYVVVTRGGGLNRPDDSLLEPAPASEPVG